MKLFRRVQFSMVAGLSLSAFTLSAQTSTNTTTTAAKPEGILPIPEYGGSLLDRAYLTGDWNGARTVLATNAGVHFDANWVQTVQGVAQGGAESKTVYGGNFDFRIRFDLMRMGVMPGAMIDVRGLSRYGDILNTESGQALPVNATGILPRTAPFYDDYGLAISQLAYIQFLSEKIGTIVGKLDTYDGDANEFASGRGGTQFMNYNFVFAAPTAIVPASTLGAGLIFLPNENISIVSTVLNSTDTSSTVGFDQLNGGISATTASLQYRLGDLPGGVNTTFIYFFNTDFVDFEGRPSFSPGLGLAPATQDYSWMTVLSGWQYLCTEEPPGEGPVDLTNGQADHQGLGLFGRVAWADEDTNPWKFTFSAGLAYRGLIPGRDNDTLGAGYYYADIDPDRFLGGDDLDDDEQGLELFYNLALTPAANLTFDVQILDSPLPESDNTTVLLGARLRTVF